MVLVDLLLQFVSLFQQRPILRGEISYNLAERFPEPIGVHTGARRDLVSDKMIQFFINLKPTYLNVVRHGLSPYFYFGLEKSDSVRCFPVELAHRQR
jgi:hypothetical protein